MMGPRVRVSYEDDGQRLRELGPKPILFRFDVHDHVIEYIPLGLVHSVLRSDVGTDDEALVIMIGDRQYGSADQQVIDRFMAEWEVR